MNFTYRDAIYKEVERTIARYLLLNPENITSDKCLLGDLELDSLGVQELIMHIEEIHRVNIIGIKLNRKLTIGDLQKFIFEQITRTGKT